MYLRNRITGEDECQTKDYFAGLTGQGHVGSYRFREEAYTVIDCPDSVVAGQPFIVKLKLVKLPMYEEGILSMAR